MQPFDVKKIFLVYSILWLFHIISGQYLSVHRNSPTSHYDEMKCTPLPNAKKVQAYKCAFEQVDMPAQKCVYKGSILNDGEHLIDEECMVSCLCSVSEEYGSSITCGFVNCPEFSTKRNESCVYQYNLNECCSYNQVCDPNEIKKLAKCRVDGVTHLEGQRFRPDGTCKGCVCRKGFSGKYVAPFCKTINCGIERFYFRSIFERCAPLYIEGENCCPFAWLCNGENVEIEKTGENSNYKCQFGKDILNIGDKVIFDDKCMKCSCDYPPLVTCLRNRNC